jgi:hypothetical protein
MQQSIRRHNTTTASPGKPVTVNIQEFPPTNRHCKWKTDRSKLVVRPLVRSHSSNRKKLPTRGIPARKPFAFMFRPTAKMFEINGTTDRTNFG